VTSEETSGSGGAGILPGFCDEVTGSERAASSEA
jgi:hypothetical protein